jgi:large subunit ribosomal protein L21
MYAIVTIAGQQFKVEKGSKIIVHQLHSAVGEEVVFDKVLLIDNEGKIKVGMPYVKDAVVTAQVLSHLRGDKIKVFKKKRRKGYQILNGHRQYFTEILIDEISETGIIKKAAKPKKTEETVVTEVKKEKAEKTENVAKTSAEASVEKPLAKKEKAVKTVEAKEKPAAKKTVKKETTTKAKPAAKKGKTDKK